MRHAREIDGEVRRILNEAYSRSLQLIKDNRDRLVKLADLLMKVETLDRPEFEKLMNAPMSNGNVVEGTIINAENMSEPLAGKPAMDAPA